MDNSAAGKSSDLSTATKWNSSAISSTATRTRRENMSSAAVESSFVPYLPQDDAVVAGLGEQEGGVDASETQEATDYLNAQLEALLHLPLHQFWNRAVKDDSLGLFLESYLRFRRRSFDNPRGRSDANDSVVMGDGDLSRHTFMTLLRMSSIDYAGASDSEIQGAMSLQRKVLNVARLMDICAIYGEDNPILTRCLVSNVFNAQAGHGGELAASIPPVLERIVTLHQRCYVLLAAVEDPRDAGIDALGVTRLYDEVLEVVDYLNDVTSTLRVFVKAYPPAASILVTSDNSVSGQGLLLSVLAAVHDTLLPILQDGIALLSGSGDAPIKFGSKVSAQDRLRQLGVSLVDLCWQLIENHYLYDVTREMTEGGPVIFSDSNQDPVWKGDSLVQAIVSVALGPSDSDAHLARELGLNVADLNCSGAMLRSLNRRHQLSSEIHMACQKGTLVLDEAQEDYLSAFMTDLKLSNGGSDAPLMLMAPEMEVEEKVVLQQSKISQVKDLFPDLGDGFISACLEAYDNDHEKVIERILNGTLHSDLSSLDTTLLDKPSKMAPNVKDKGKGKVTEQTVSNNLEEGGSLIDERGLSSSLAGSSGAASGSLKEKQTMDKPINHSGATGGRYVRQQQGDVSFSDLLDSSKGDKDLRAVIRAAAALEYEDEYDDSFDELGGYVADTGGNEETEILADEVNQRNEARDQRVLSRNNNRPVLLTPWGSSTPATVALRARSEPQKSSAVTPMVEGRGHDTSLLTRLGGQGRGGRGGRGRGQKSSAIVPEFEDQAHDAQSLTESAGQGRGGQGGRGRGQKSSAVVPEVEDLAHDTQTADRPAALRGGNRYGRERTKMKEQAQKPQFYLKDGKLYNHKVTGAVGVASIEEAEAIKHEEAEKIWGLGAGGNVPIPQETASGSGQDMDRQEENSAEGRGRGGRGRSRNNGGRRGSGQGSFGRRDDGNHHRKDNAMKKHFQGLGGL